MQCRDCGATYQDHLKVCPACGATRGATRWWAIIGGLFFVLSLGIMIAAYLFVEKKRTSRIVARPETINTSPSTTATPAIAPTLSSLSKQELLQMVPVHIMSKFKSEAGDNLPDDLRVVGNEAEQFLVLVGARLNDENKREKMVSIFKMEGGSLADVSKEVLPVEFNDGHIGDEFTQLAFYKSNPDILLATPASAYNNDLIEECFACEHAYKLQPLYWCDNSYQIGSQSWRNDPYTAFYLTAQALSQRSIDTVERDFINEALDIEILNGFTREANQPWRAQNLTSSNPRELKTLDTINYSLANGVKAITITVSRQENGQWQATKIERQP